jgi:hypothetical protein
VSSSGCCLNTCEGAISYAHHAGHARLTNRGCITSC